MSNIHEDEEVKLSQVVIDTNAFEDWFNANISYLTVKAKEMGLEAKLKEIMRMAWRRCSEVKNKEVEEHLKYIKALKEDIDLKQVKYDELHMELQKITIKLISAEKNAKK